MVKLEKIDYDIFDEDEIKEVVCQGESSDEIKQTLLGCHMMFYPGFNGELYPKLHIVPIDEKLENIPDVHEYAKIIQEEYERNIKKQEEWERKKAENIGSKI